jgi:hypothetical protein
MKTDREIIKDLRNELTSLRQAHAIRLTALENTLNYLVNKAASNEDLCQLTGDTVKLAESVFEVKGVVGHIVTHLGLCADDLGNPVHSGEGT